MNSTTRSMVTRKSSTQRMNPLLSLHLCNTLPSYPFVSPINHIPVFRMWENNQYTNDMGEGSMDFQQDHYPEGYTGYNQ